METLEKEYRNRFEQYEEEPEDFVWEAIQARIQPEPKRRMAIVWWQYGIAASVLIGLFLAIYFLNQPKNDDLVGINTQKPSISSTQKSKSGIVVNEKSEENSNISNNTENINNSDLIINSNKLKNNVISENINNSDLSKYLDNNVISENTDNSNSSNNSDYTNKSINTENSIVNNNIENTNQIINNVNSKQSDNTINSIKNILSENIVNNINSENKNNSINTENKINSEFSINNESKNSIIENNSTENIERVDFAVNNALEGKKTQFLSIDEPKNRIPVYEYYAQQNEDKDERRLVFIPPSEVFVNVSPTLSYYAFNPNKVDNVNIQFNDSQNRLGFAAQAGFTYPIAKKLNLRTAFSYLTGRSKFQYLASPLNAPKNVTVLNDYSIKIEDAPIQVKTETRNWQYLELQSDLMYEIKRNQAFTAGFRAGVQSRDLRKALVHTRLGYRFSKPVSNRFALWMEPSMSFSLTNQSSVNNLFLYRTRGFGLNMGVSLLNY